MKILVYSDSGYESMVNAFLASRKYSNSEDVHVLYYTVGFESTLEYTNLTKIRWDLDTEKPDLTYYKPDILIDGLNYDKHILYMDCDIVLSKRFDPKKIINESYELPMSSSGPQDHVWIWKSFGEETIVYDETKLMEYFGIAERSCKYLWASMISYNDNCLDFLEEWKSILLNPYLLKKKEIYFPFREETAYNITLWKRGCTDFFDLVFFNTTSFDSFLDIETEENVVIDKFREYSLDNLDTRLYETCDDSSRVLFYHGFKPGKDLDSVVEWMKNKMTPEIE